MLLEAKGIATKTRHLLASLVSQIRALYRKSRRLLAIDRKNPLSSFANLLSDKNKRSSKITALIYILYLLSPESVSAEVIKWQEAIREASLNNSELKSARQRLESAKYQKNASFSDLLPDVSANLGYTKSNTGSGGSGSVLGSFGMVRESYTASIIVNQNLFSGFSTVSIIEQKKANQALVQASLDSVKAKVSFELKSAFAGLTYAQDAIKLTKEIEKRRLENLRLVELRFEGGRENRGSYLLSRAAYSQAQYEALQAEQNLTIASQELARVLGRDSHEELFVSDSLPLGTPQMKVEFQEIARQVPEYYQALARYEIADAQLTQARSPFLPSLDLTASAGKLGQQFFPQSDRWNIGLSLSVPIFQGGKDYFSLKSSLSERQAATFDQTETSRKLIVKLNEVHAKFILAVQKLQVDSDYLNAAEVRAEIARNKYNNGLISFEDWDIIENDLISRQKVRLQSQRDRALAEASWEQVQGKGVTD